MIRGVWKRVPLPRSSGTKKELAHRCSETHTDGADIGSNELHGVVDRHAGGDGAAGRVDVEPDVFAGIFTFEIQQLRHDLIGNRVVDVAAENHDAVLEEHAEDVCSRVCDGGGHSHLRCDRGIRHRAPSNGLGSAPRTDSGRLQAPMASPTRRIEVQRYNAPRTPTAFTHMWAMIEGPRRPLARITRSAKTAP